MKAASGYSNFSFLKRNNFCCWSFTEVSKGLVVCLVDAAPRLSLTCRDEVLKSQILLGDLQKTVDLRGIS